MALEPLIHDYGYLAIVIVTFLEGETIAIVAGVAAHAGLLEVEWVIAAAIAGSFSGDQLWHFMGRRWGPRLFARRASWQRRAERVYHHLRRNQDWLMLTFRFYYGLRSVTPFAIGAAQLPLRRFLALNFIGAVLWAAIFVCAGYALGEAARGLIDEFQIYGRYVLAGLLLAGLAFWVAAANRGRRKAVVSRNEERKP